MKNLVKIVSFSKEMTLRVVALFLSVIICTLTIGNSFVCTQNISRVYATEVAVTLAADAVWELILGFLASTGLTAAAIENRDALLAQYKKQLDAEIATDEYIIDSAIELYDSATGAIQSIPIDEISFALENYHDTAVDNLTGIYAKYCPALLCSMKDFVSSVVNKDITIDGLTEIIDSCVTSRDIASQWLGESYSYDIAVRFEYDYTNPNTSITQHIVDAYIVNSTYDLPLCSGYFVDEPCYLSDGSYIITHKFMFYKQYNATSWKSYNLSGTRIKIVDGVVTESTFSSKNAFVLSEYFDTSFYNHNVQATYDMNIPVFSSTVDLQNYLAGTGAVTGALNYSTDITDGITDNNDLPTIGNFADEIWARVADAVDVGIGSYGAGVGVNDWADDIPFVGLGALQDYANSLQDVFDRAIDDILNGVYDPTLDIPNTYDDAWNDVIDRTWDDVIENDMDRPIEGDTPIEGDIDTPIEDDIDTPIEDDSDKPISDDKENTNSSSKGKWAVDLSKYFPFCIPFDLIHLFSVLDAEPVAPRWEVPFKIPEYGIDYTFVLDLSIFDEVAKIFRIGETLLFICGLILSTRKLIKG